jgi:ECF sigma factor
MEDAGRKGETISALLAALKYGDREAEAEADLMELVYGDLRRIAARYLAGERKNHTLQPTALVNGAYLKLMAQDLKWKNRAHFFCCRGRRNAQYLSGLGSCPPSGKAGRRSAVGHSRP